MATSETEICNSALLKLGAKRITDLTDDSPTARACRDCYGRLRDAELRKYVWSFAVDIATLAEEVVSPSWGRAHKYQLPSDFLRFAPDYAHDNYLDKDWVQEGRFIVTDDVAPLRIRYVKKVTDTSQFDPLYDDALSCRIALELCEQITQSNTKKASARQDYRDAIDEAKRVAAIEKIAQMSPDSEWISRRA